MIDKAGRIRRIHNHLHSQNRVYPTMANGIQIAAAAGLWGLSAGFTEIIPVDTITSDFAIHHINVEAASDADTYEIVLYVGTTEIGRVRITFIDIANSQTLPSLPFIAEVIPANSQIQAKIATKGGGSDTIDISLAYHLH